MHTPCGSARPTRVVPRRGTLRVLNLQASQQQMATAPAGQDAAEATFALAGEDHTLGNTLRYMLNKNPEVVFAGYRRAGLSSSAAGARRG